jgi:hypothetical protein
VFGAAHVPLWDVWKFPSTFVTGLFLGFLFLRYGLAAAIVFHFLNDYLPPVVALSAQTAFPVLVVVALYLLMVVGVANAGRYLILVRDFLRFRELPPHLERGPEPEPTKEAAAPLEAATPPSTAPSAAPLAAPSAAPPPEAPPPNP